MSDTASQSVPHLDNGEQRHTLTVYDVGVALTSAGVPRSHRQIIRYCETGMLDAVKVPGPTGDQWFVSPASLPKAIGDLKQWQAQRERHGTTQPAAASRVEVQIPLNEAAAVASHGAPEPAASATETLEKGSETEQAMARHARSELDVYEHPYVRRLEAHVEKLEGKLDAQVRRTEEIQSKNQAALIELQRMTAVGQSQTLADFMLKARDWVLGQAEAEKREEASRVDNSASPQ